jgi:hypothetical protein
LTRIPYIEREVPKFIEREKPIIIYKDAGRLTERLVPSGPPQREIVYRDREVGGGGGKAGMEGLSQSLPRDYFVNSIPWACCF